VVSAETGTTESSHPFDIYIVGLGIQGVRQMTREAEAAIRESTAVFVVDTGFGVHEYLRSLCPHIVDLLPLYQEGKSRDIIYRKMAAAVIQAALQDAPVTFATYGHPMMFSFPPTLIRRAGALLGLRTHTMPGISALDTLILDLGFDPGTEGLQMYEATDILIRERPLQPDVPLLLWQVAAVETGLFTGARGNAKRFHRLQEYLLRFYPEEHQVTMALSSSFPLVDSLTESFPLRELATRLAIGSQSGTLFVPPASRRPVAQDQILQQAYDPGHLKEITSQAPTR
jgi:uncharacterized protein YabN with tetrapyrrole methylase and pyrophosphatase domain